MGGIVLRSPPGGLVKRVGTTPGPPQNLFGRGGSFIARIKKMTKTLRGTGPLKEVKGPRKGDFKNIRD